MTIGVGGSTWEAEPGGLTSMGGEVSRISDTEYRERFADVQRLMGEQGIDAFYLDASTSLYYFSGVRFWASECVHQAVVPVAGDLAYISPAFEEDKTLTMLRIGDDVRVWEEHEDPAGLVMDTVRSLGYGNRTIAVDESSRSLPSTGCSGRIFPSSL